MGYTGGDVDAMKAKEKIVRRCAWCTPKHRMDSDGNAIPGDASVRPPDGVIFTDGMCSKAIKRFKIEASNWRKGK